MKVRPRERAQADDDVLLARNMVDMGARDFAVQQLDGGSLPQHHVDVGAPDIELFHICRSDPVG